jgi:hypothetical protein
MATKFVIGHAGAATFSNHNGIFLSLNMQKMNVSSFWCSFVILILIGVFLSFKLYVGIFLLFYF